MQLQQEVHRATAGTASSGAREVGEQRRGGALGRAAAGDGEVGGVPLVRVRDAGAAVVALVLQRREAGQDDDPARPVQRQPEAASGTGSREGTGQPQPKTWSATHEGKPAIFYHGDYTSDMKHLRAD